MPFDVDGYGFPEQSRTVARLLDDLRVMGPSAVVRVARAWDASIGNSRLDELHAAEKAALQLIEQQGRDNDWDEVRREVLQLTEGGQALVSWKAEHGDAGHKAERSTLAAALGLMTAQQLAPEHLELLLAPMASTLPWLMPERRPLA